MDYDKTTFLSGLAMGLIGKGDPTFTGSDVFAEGYLVGAELRRKRVLPEKMLKYPLGSLRCRTIKTPKNYSHTSTWTPKAWNGLTDFDGNNIWTDGKNIYCNNGNGSNYILNGDTWEPKVWNGLTNFDGNNIWTDGKNIYYSYNFSQYILNGDTWEPKEWGGLTSFNANEIWTDGKNIYRSYATYYDSSQYVLNGDTWEPKVWNGFEGIHACEVWSDGENIYCTRPGSNNAYVLNGDTWEKKTWNEVTDINTFTPGIGTYIWTDGKNIYYSRTWNSVGNHRHAVLNDGMWELKVWNGHDSFIWDNGRFDDAASIWSDGVHIYLSQYVDGVYEHYVLT